MPKKRLIARHACMPNKTQFVSVLACSVYMVDRVTDDKLTASSIYGSSYTANKARLSSNGWSPDASKSNPWIQVMHICSLTTGNVYICSLTINKARLYC